MPVPQLRAPGLAEPAALRPAGHGVRALLGELFPAPQAPALPAGAPRRVFLLAVQFAAVALGALLLLERIAGRPVWDRLYAEDRGIYLPQALAHPWHLLQSYGGYLQLVARLIGQIVSLLPIRYAAVGFAVSGALVASGCGLFAYHASAGHISSRWLRALLGLSVLLLPVAPLEIADNAVNALWYLLVALFWAALWRPRSASGVSAAAVVGFLAAASSPLALGFAPLLAARALVVPRRVREHAVTAGWAAGSAAQVLVIMTSHQSRTGHPRPANSLLYYAHAVVLPALGWHLAWHLRAAFGLSGATLIAGAFLAMVLTVIVVTQARRCRVFVITAVAVGVAFTFVTATLGWTPGHRVTVAMEPGARYSTIPILLLDAAMIVAADAYARRCHPRPRTLAAVAALVAVLAVGWVTDFRYPVYRLRGPVWALTANAWLRHCRHSPQGSITVVSGAWFGKAPVTTFSCSSLRR